MKFVHNGKNGRKTVRLKNWDFSSSASYFVTICTKNRNHFFGEIVKGNMEFSKIGKIAYTEWFRAIEMRPDMNIVLGEFIVMPDHVHGIFSVGKNIYNTHCRVATNPPSRVATHCDSTGGTFGPQSKNLASIIRGYKSAVTTYARKNGIEFNWQSRFHERIIRSDMEFQRIGIYTKEPREAPVGWQRIPRVGSQPIPPVGTQRIPPVGSQRIPPVDATHCVPTGGIG